MKSLNRIFSISVILLMLIFTSCKKTEVTPVDPTDTNTYAKFSSIDSISTFYVSSENDSFKIPISVNLTSNTDRSISISYTSNTAVMDQQYSANNTFVLSAGKQADSLTIQGIYAGFSSSSQIDTLKITIVSNADIKADKSHTSFYLILRKKCPSIDLNDLLGTYLNTNEVSSWNGAYGPYTTSITSVQNVTSTTGTIVVENIYDYGWPAVTFNLNWTNPQNPIATVVAQNGITDGAGTTIYDVRPFPTGNLGSFSTCDNVLTLIMQVRIDGGNWDTTPYVVNLAR